MNYLKIYILIFEVFDDDEKLNGIRLHAQQIMSLFTKRALILKQKYLFGLLVFSLLLIIQVIACIKSSTTSNLNKEFISYFKRENIKKIDLNLELYGSQNLPYRIIAENSSMEYVSFKENLDMFFALKNHVNLIKVENSTINDFILKKERLILTI